ncbi:hypothetical protein FRC17_008842 [Serendipita sp. 399]|nr:hypothetical protein FRC17_008842 [Serendipita sp. 399]
MAMDFRKINIDQYDEDKLLEEELYEPDPRDPQTVLTEAKQKATGIITLQSLLLILNSTKPTDIPSIIKALPSEAQDTLMKYLYKAMAMPGYADVNSGALLTWHEKLTDAAGIGCIIRVMTDRRTV